MTRTPIRNSTPAQPGSALRFDCPVSGRCGGCQLSHMTYPQQLAHKQRRMERLLQGVCPVSPILGMENPYHYRAKVHAVLAHDKKLGIYSGVYAPGTHRVVPVTHCLLEDARADAIIQTIVGMIPRYKLRIYNENTHRGFLRHILIRTGNAMGQIMVILVATAQEFPGGKAFVAELLTHHPEITTVVLNINQRETSMVLGKKDIPLFGPGYLEDELCGKRFRISPQSFYQVNARQTEVLYRTAIDLAGLTGTETLLDAYCGTGTIGLCAADKAQQIIGVELNPDAIRDAKENARLNSITNAQFFCDDAGRFLTKMAQDGHPLDVLMMDPPRSGSTPPFLQSSIALGPKRIVYVSCGPETLARDLKILIQGGYRAEKAVPVDMFPGTEHIETVVLLSKGEIDSKKVRVEFSLEGMDMSGFQNDATYGQIKERVLEQTGLKVSSLYIAQVKQKHGIIERENYNKPKSENARQPQCPPEKEKAIAEALKYFGMV